MQVVGKTDVGPVVYSHHKGHDTPEIVRRFVKRMSDRKGDIPYLTARLLQELMGTDQRDTGFGVWNSTERLTAEDTHYDAGVVLIDADTFACECVGGYLRTGADGMPFVPRDDDND